MNISEAARQSKLSSKTIRYYEDIGLIKPSRAENGYRDYSVDDTHRLAFIQRSRSLGFSVDECRLLLSLYDDDERASADVKRLALAKISEIEAKIDELESLKRTLASLARNCHGDDRPECPIMDDLMGKH
ncbi:MAG: Cu(I)-responsive transcriptional regulator [Pseudomonadota bacterium]